ncbi:MarR family transcriptional regulator [Spiroplasma endosymbiont of Polydrusus pterygomalis]|uniref:MarR family transcriptional regulator n=1 Tax=Spiroplasma endosymbiont of Polydrusus pterygomalis TaxID=3139327 RepID=UPI003CCABC13
MEQIKILEIINRWGYLNIYQIAMLLNQDVGTVATLVRILVNKKLLRVDQLTRKNIYMLSNLGNRKLDNFNLTKFFYFFYLL